MSSDKMLVQAVLAGEKRAFEKLYDRYGPLVRAICYDATGRLSDAQDLAQDVFMRAYEKLAYLHKQDSFSKWLVGITKLRCREWHRQKSKGRYKNVELDCAGSVAFEHKDNGQVKELLAAIGLLTKKERLALHAFYLQDKSAENARKVMGLSRSGFYRVLERARKRLERLLVQEREDIK